MAASFVAYIDESGCEGFKFLDAERGSSRWFVLSALVFRKENDAQAVKLAREIREVLHKPALTPLHFRHLRHEQRIPLVRRIGTASVRTVSVLIHKPSIPEPEVFQQHKFSLYRYATRLLVERVSWLCRDSYRAGHGDRRVELIFSNRSAMSYDDMRDYFVQLRANPCGESRIDWDVIDPSLIRAVNHEQLAGLQLVDAVASGVFFAVHKNLYGEVEPRYLELLSPTIYRHEHHVKGYGLKFWCADQAEIDRVLSIVQV